MYNVLILIIIQQDKYLNNSQELIMPLKRSPVAHKTRSHGITSHVTHNDDYNMVEECAALQEGQRSGGNSTPEDSPQQDATPLDNFMDEPIPSRADMWKQLTDIILTPY